MWCYYGMISHNLMITAQNVVLCYDMAYLNDNSAKFVFCGTMWHTLVTMAPKLWFYGMILHILMIMVQNFVFEWYNIVYLNDNKTKFCVQWSCLLISVCPVNSNVYLDCPVDIFTCVMS